MRNFALQNENMMTFRDKKRQVLMLAVFVISVGASAQFVKIDKYPSIPAEYEAAFVDQVTDYVSGVVKSLYARWQCLWVRLVLYHTGW